jgi:Uma2 family endonuclease
MAARRAPVFFEEDPEIPPEIFDPGPWVHRWVDGPDGRRELRETHLTPEYFLDPQIGDQMVQGSLHAAVTLSVFELLKRRFLSREDVLVTSDVKLLWETQEVRRPAPDIMVIYGIRDRERNRPSFRVVEERVRPSLVIEVVSPADERIRQTDHVDKAKLYAQEEIPEYLLLDLPRDDEEDEDDKEDEPLRWTGYRRDAQGRYQKIEPDPQGRIYSQTTGLWFGVSPDGRQVWLTDAMTGERLLTPAEEESARRIAESRAEQESDARRAAESEIARLRAEIARLKGEAE